MFGKLISNFDQGAIGPLSGKRRIRAGSQLKVENPSQRHGARSGRLRQIVFSHLFQMKGKAFLAICFLVAFAAFELLNPWPLKIIFDQILLNRPLAPSLWFLESVLLKGPVFSIIVMSGAIIAFAVLSACVSYGQVYLTAKIAYQLTHLLRTELFSRLQRLSLSFHTKARSGELLTKVTSDTSVLKELFADWALTMVVHFVTFLGMIIVMLLLNWELSLVPFATLPILFVALRYINWDIRKSVYKQRKQEGRIASRINEVLASIPLIQAFGRECYEEERFQEKSEENLEAGIRTVRASAAVTRIVYLVGSLGVAGTVLFGSWLVLKGRMTPGDLLIFVAYVGKLYRPLRGMGRLLQKFSQASSSAQRISQVLELEPEIRDHAKAQVASSLKGEIEFDNVSFGYGEGTDVLKHTCFRIQPGQRVALVGTSGAGKSTIISLILRLYEPWGGTISIDGIDVRKYRLDSLRNSIGIVLQGTFLFGVSLAENISYGKPEATQEEIEEAARLAHAHEFIEALPDGYDTVLGDRGDTLSGGQRQRISLARALIKRPSILILDEPTSAIDSVSASLIHDAVANAQKGKTTLVVAHHFSSMDGFDQILVLDKGRIVEHGTHEQLMDKQGHYSEFFHYQTA